LELDLDLFRRQTLIAVKNGKPQRSIKASRVEEFCVPTLQMIETWTMMNINQEFDQHFQR
jgi:hypothetical protein